MGGYRPGPVALALGLLVMAFLLAPLLSVVPMSFTPARYLQMPQGEWSLRHYAAVLGGAEWRGSLWLSARLALASSLIATLLATLFALGVWLAQPRLAPLLVGYVLAPMVVPPVVSAVVLYFLLSRLSRLLPEAGYDSFGGVLLAHVVVTAPFAVIVLMVALSRVDRRTELAARGMGAGLWQTCAWVILPQVRFGVLSAWAMSFVLSWEEIAVTLFITSVQTVTLPRRMWMGLRDNIDPAIAAVSVLLIAVTVAGVLARMFWRGGSRMTPPG